MLWYYFIFLALSILSFLIKRIITPKNPNTTTHTPPSHPLIGCLISFYNNRHRLLDWYTLHLSQSPTQTILLHRLGARRTIVTANPLNVEYILKTNFINFPKGKPFTEILGDLLGCGIFNVDGELWSTQRKLASHEFSTRSLKEFIVKNLEDEVKQRLIPLLEEACNSNNVIDMQDVLRRLTFDIVCKVSLGYDPCCLDLSKPLPPLLSAFDRASEISAMRATSPVFFIWKVKRLLNIGSEKSLKEAVKLVHQSVIKIIKNKKKELSEKNDGNIVSGSDLLTKLLEAGHDEIMVRDMVISMIMAGRDTTSAAMTWLFSLLSKHPNKEALIVKGVRKIFGGKNNNDKFELARSFDYEGLKEMKYLKACLCESMRLYPPVAWDSKHAARDDVLPDGTRVGKGDKVTYFPYGMGRMEELWGKDWREFKPDRWFERREGDDNEVLKYVNPYKFSVFQAGPRVCLGKEMAFIEMEYVVSTILNGFEIRPVSVDQPVYVPLLTAHMAGGFKVRVHKRVQNGK
ncbi:cytochrome P450 94B3-like [Cicer arietinum]|uniref:Cytochrome P450 94B3-like n=1 Tax=Cicer arietinum TaxID=3827 RepID=A0A1S2YAY6_CICAR|nr:cytochrome P450 94B3-like [Cicer arietinum]